MKSFFTFLTILLFLFSGCKKKDPTDPDNNPFTAVFTEQFDEISDWQYFEQEYDSISQFYEYMEKSFSFSEGKAVLYANQNEDCERIALSKGLSNSSEIMDIIETDTLLVSFYFSEIEYSGMGWSTIAIALDNHVLRFSIRQINEPTEYTLKIANWEMYDLFTVGDSEADLKLDYSNNPEILGTNKIIIRADACGADLYASTKLVLDKIILAHQN